MPAKVSESSLETVQYAGEAEASIDFYLDPDSEVIWATQAQIADLFSTSQSNVSQHPNNIFTDEELVRDSNIRNFNIASSATPVRLTNALSTAFRLGLLPGVRYQIIDLNRKIIKKRDSTFQIRTLPGSGETTCSAQPAIRSTPSSPQPATTSGSSSRAWSVFWRDSSALSCG